MLLIPEVVGVVPHDDDLLLAHIYALSIAPLRLLLLDGSVDRRCVAGALPRLRARRDRGARLMLDVE